MVKLRSRLLKNGKYSLYLDIVKDGVRQYEFLKIHLSDDYTSSEGKKRVKDIDKDLFERAKIITSHRTQEVLSSEHGFIPNFKKHQDFIEFASEVAAANKAYKSTVSILKKFVGDKVLLFSHINANKINEFVNFCKAQNFINNTTNQYLTLLKAIWNKAIIAGIVKENPFATVAKLKGTHAKIEYLTIEEIQLLNETEVPFNPHIRLAFLFACFTGLRISDIQRLEWKNIVANQIEFRQKKSKTEFLRIPLSVTALSILAKLEQGEGKLFSKLPSSDSHINEKLKIWQLMAGLTKNLHFHMARHSFATLQISNNTDLYQLSKLMGHSSIVMTQKYAKVIDNKKQEAIDRMPIIEIK